VNHIQDQDLLLLAHRSLGFFQSISASLHMRGCSSCRKRYAALDSLSSGVASAVRLGLPTWHPLGLALRTKVLLATLALGVTVLGARSVLTREEVVPMTPLPPGVEMAPVKCVTPALPGANGAAPGKGGTTPLNKRAAPRSGGATPTAR
jgi:hypothetical protein